jgi:hypothetical protein
MKNGPYELVIAPEEYPGKRYRGRYIYEHHLVWWENTGEVVTEPMLIHHKDENKRNNAFKNLEKKARAKHTVDHNQKPLVEAECSWCHKNFLMRKGNLNTRLKMNVNLHCSRSCSVKHQMQLQRNDVR